jgi:hypothetical protein
VYVWDFAEGMQMLRWFWDAATKVDPSARALEVPTVFSNVEDYWRPMQARHSRVGEYLTSLPASHREVIADVLRSSLPIALTGTIALTARAWSIRGRAVRAQDRLVPLPPEAGPTGLGQVLLNGDAS